MDPSSLDQSHGIQFSSKVRSLFNAPVVSSVADGARGFWLVASFSRSRIRLNEDSVSKILHSTLGGSPSSFSVLELEDCLFKFAVFDRRVGLHIYAMKFFACDSFKVFFHLWNQSGLASARISRTLDQGLVMNGSQSNHRNVLPRSLAITALHMLFVLGCRLQIRFSPDWILALFRIQLLVHLFVRVLRIIMALQSRTIQGRGSIQGRGIIQGRGFQTCP
jgi:hypothetical protein